MTMTKTQIAIPTGKTLFPTKVKSVLDGLGKTEKLIKRSTNIKLGKSVTKGKYKGFPIYTLTLEERATCPKSCAHWANCYGNNMPFATRYDVGPEFEKLLRDELKELQRKHPKGFLVRLHVLGDFYSVGYVAQWGSWLSEFPALHVYGYTANQFDASDANEKAIGQAILTIRENANGRFAIRFSGSFSDTFAANSFDDTRAQKQVEQKQAFLCPTQIAKETGKLATRDQETLAPDCGACGACWQSQKTVVFLTH